MSDSTRAVHVEGVGALFAACERRGVRRVVHISAIGVDTVSETAFARTKREADEALIARDLDWVTLRPSVVVGRGAYGGSALIRALAALPVMVPLANADRLMQPVHVDELSDTIAFFLRSDAPVRRVLEIVGPRPITLHETIVAYRAWLGLVPVPTIGLPRVLARLAFAIGDVISLLGWRPPLRTTALRQLDRDVIGDPSEWTKITAIRPSSLKAILASDPAGAQEKWFARLYLLKALVLAVLAAFWVATGVITLYSGRPAAEALLREAGWPEAWVAVSAIGGGILDVLLGIAVAVRQTAKATLITTLVVSVGYLVAASALLPRLWIDPLGSLVKIFPIMVLTLVALAILDDR